MNRYQLTKVGVSFGAKPAPERLELATARDWALRLLGNLNALSGKYAEANAAPHLETEIGESRQLLLAAALKTVIDSLLEMPRFQGAPAITPLHDLLGALLDLHVGKKSPLLNPREVTAAATTINTGFVRRHALLCVRIMEMAGLKETPACAHVASVMRKFGYTGRKKGPFPLSTLTDWIAVLDDHDKRFLKRKLADVIADKGDRLDPALATLLVEGYLSSELMLSKR